ncbi:hypothetical protein A9Q81_01815 [Gammaproteobacteria bacterium 42_54_T18]|nr:hypothetical protein A9Q81_01815 [Gammaproteobacteria bacterium 42_54_T18]
MKKSLLIKCIVTIVLSVTSTFTFASGRDVATDLTTLLRSARAITVNSVTINDPSAFNLSDFVTKTKSNYEKSAGKKFDESNVLLTQLMDSMTYVIKNAKEGRYEGKWSTGAYANKFLPARFARLSGLRFEELTGGKAIIRLTTSAQLLVNTENKADSWEEDVIEQKFRNPSWPKNKIHDNYTNDGYRLMLPEYYKAGCMRCHGGGQGKAIHAEPVEGHLGEFGGAISVLIYDD